MFRTLIFLLLGFYFQQMSAQLVKDELIRSKIYDAINSRDTALLSQQLNSIHQIKSKDTLAYSGALHMKLAGLLGSPREKLREFRHGRKNLEQAIETDSLNTEYRFLRLIIQENAPGILNYNSQLNEDKHYILTTFIELPNYLKAEIRKYSHSSKVISQEELKP